ncbi:MAG: class I SAM-dependent methyltransferase [candidate division WOR-3 bacterium]|nr:MAG: class I SAM-dependent methyltransferase [candidate division WOR-3 bacterium]
MWSEKAERVDVKTKYDHLAQWYDVFEFFIEVLAFTFWRKKIFKLVKEKTFLEVGVGTGKNLRYYPAHAKATAIDFSEGMLKYAKQRAAKMGLDANLKAMDVQALRFEPDSFPNIIGSFVFCSVPDPLKGLRELKKVCTPDGRIVLLEHVRPKNFFLGKLFDCINPVVVKRTGVNINRDTAQNIREAGFDIEMEKNLFGNVFKLFVARPRKAAD